jgi:CHASE3 domain sensor protein
MGRFSGIEAKLFGSFVILVLTGLIVEGTRYFALNKVIQTDSRDILAQEDVLQLIEHVTAIH